MMLGNLFDYHVLSTLYARDPVELEGSMGYSPVSPLGEPLPHPCRDEPRTNRVDSNRSKIDICRKQVHGSASRPPQSGLRAGTLGRGALLDPPKAVYEP